MRFAYELAQGQLAVAGDDLVEAFTHEVIVPKGAHLICLGSSVFLDSSSGRKVVPDPGVMVTDEDVPALCGKFSDQPIYCKRVMK